ncbi:glycosyltransferase family 57 protein [Piedraia hortae CBS 480.64]|uniref:Alpha-1,3-glucosyltransferase n=1 Tax=Piedraia hortae CBS 480.64 TaxID=1314780 RepID=A0A6A7C549_9PEZI|nr:glycosyltransferase family 57 protein [Piedraia hortae CBS 480.64]
MAEPHPSLGECAVVATAFKVLLYPAYKSTDFEVHRNWLAIAHSLPLREWYYEKTSEWTLDYPPFFAYFEWLLSQAAALVDSEMLQIKNLNYDSWQTIYFQRTTVLVTEFVLLYALHRLIQTSPESDKRRSNAVALTIFFSPGLLIIDHLHFQYNGFLYGILILSIVMARRPSGCLASGIIFAALLCFKHIYLYLAPTYFVFLLRTYCLDMSYFRVRFNNCIKLGLGIALVAALAFGPFLYLGQMDQVLKRMFPFSRGLCHAYWAPNVWAMYSFCDRVLLHAASYLKLSVKAEAVKSVTRGLVGDSSFAVLPDITPKMTFILTLIAQSPGLVGLFLYPTWDNFVGTLTVCGYASFLFGWHVHEKAILLVLIPFSLIAIKDRRFLAAFRPLAVSGHVSLFPLLFTSMEFPLKFIYTITWLIITLTVFDGLAPPPTKERIFLLDRFAVLYIVLSIPLVAYCSLVHQLVFGDMYEFIPLMFISSYSAVGVIGSWVGFMVVFLTSMYNL